jgi:polysaccharide pyruvyl transferase WcaK-like protein
MNFDMDKVIAKIVNLIVGLSKYGRFKVWQPGEKLKILLIGYNGKRNTGSDVRVAGMVEQFYYILGRENIEIGVLTLNRKSSEVYFQPPTELIEFSSIFFLPLLRACSSYHMGVLSEGSCLKSKWANSLTLFFVEGAGVMKQQGKPCIAYGSEAGEMDKFVYEIAQRLCTKTYFIARTQASLDVIQEMGLKGEIGTDTAWIFPPASEEWAETELKEKAGWDGKTPILGVAVINPFWWPVKPSLRKWIIGEAKRNPQYHYEKYYFFSHSDEREELFNNYLSSIARAVDEFAERHNTHVIIFGMEALDYDACTTLQKILRTPAYFFSSIHYDGYQLTALLRKLSMLVTSRYHARVLSMPRGVPSIAVSMDERLYNLMIESGHLEDYYFEVDDRDLEEKLIAAMEKIWENRESVSQEILRAIPMYLKKMAGMGATFRNFVKENFPLFPLPPEPENWTGYLPPLYPELSKVIETAEKVGTGA